MSLNGDSSIAGQQAFVIKGCKAIKENKNKRGLQRGAGINEILGVALHEMAAVKVT